MAVALLGIASAAQGQTGCVARFSWHGTNSGVAGYTGIADNTLYWGWGG
jgi:hypothetical protein